MQWSDLIWSDYIRTEHIRTYQKFYMGISDLIRPDKDILRILIRSYQDISGLIRNFFMGCDLGPYTIIKEVDSVVIWLMNINSITKNIEFRYLNGNFCAFLFFIYGHLVCILIVIYGLWQYNVIHISFKFIYFGSEAKTQFFYLYNYLHKINSIIFSSK